MKIFSTDSVTIIRKKGDGYTKEDITTSSILSGSNVSPEKIRRNVIERLRGDKSVFLVLEGKDGECHEEATHSSGFHFIVEVHDGDKQSAKLRINFKDALAYEEDFAQGSDEDPDVFDLLIDTVIDLLASIEDGDLSFVDDSCPYFTHVEPEDPVSLYEAGNLLDKEGFETEHINTVSYLPGPYLFVHENEIILLGSHRFDGESLFLEMKRLFHGINQKIVEQRLETVKKEFYGINVIQWEDGSWSFRMDLDEEVCKSNFGEKLLAGIAEIRRMISALEDQDGIGCEPWSITTEQRHLFIYETIDASLKYTKINI